MTEPPRPDALDEDAVEAVARVLARPLTGGSGGWPAHTDQARDILAALARAGLVPRAELEAAQANAHVEWEEAERLRADLERTERERDEALRETRHWISKAAEHRARAERAEHALRQARGEAA